MDLFSSEVELVAGAAVVEVGAVPWAEEQPGEVVAPVAVGAASQVCGDILLQNRVAAGEVHRGGRDKADNLVLHQNREESVRADKNPGVVVEEVHEDRARIPLSVASVPEVLDSACRQIEDVVPAVAEAEDYPAAQDHFDPGCFVSLKIRHCCLQLMR